MPKRTAEMARADARQASAELPDPAREDVLWIHDLAWDGRGVARRSDGRVVMVWGGIPGDSVRASITSRETKKGALDADMVEVLDRSPQRVPHPCPHYQQGCPASMLGAVRREFSLNWKHQHLVETFRRVGKFDGIVVDEVISSPNQWRYRERLEMHIERVHGLLQIGYQSREGLVPIYDCRLGSLALRPAYRTLRVKLALMDDDPRVGRTPMRLLLRDNGRGGAVGVLFVVGQEQLALDPLVRWLKMAPLAGWQVRSAPEVDSRFWASKVEAQEGEVGIAHWIAGDILTMPPTVFAQANRAAAEILMRVALEHVPASGHLVDLFGGFGAFGFEHAVRGGTATVVEASTDAVQTGRDFAAKRKLPVDFVEKDLTRVRPGSLPLGDADAVIMDPPRAGATKDLLRVLDSEGPEHLLYVSCHPAALARDLGRLDAYKVDLVVPVDLFPNTGELEVLSVLRRR